MAFLTLALAPNYIEDSASATTTLNLSATVEPVLSMGVATYNPSTSDYDPTIKDIIMEIEHGATSTLTSRILTSTNNATGYTLSLKDTDNITDLAPVSSTTTIGGTTTYTYNTTGAVISPVSANTSLSSFNDNTWGYAIQTTSTTAPEPSTPTTYNPITTTATSIHNTSTPSSNYHYFTVATKVGDILPANTYQDQVVFSLVANSLPYMPDFFNTEYMQDFTPTICNSVETPLASTTDVTADNGADYYVINSHPTKVPSTKVKDKRDEQEYTIRKLADGNCWMTENLRFGAAVDNQTVPSLTPEKRIWDSTTDPSLTNTTTAGKEKLTSTLTSTRISQANNCGDIFNKTVDSRTTPSVCIYQANTNSTFDTEYNTAKIGALYNFCAASGGTVCSTEPNMNNIPGAVDNTHPTAPRVAGSICPTNWSLPQMTGTPTGSGGTNTGYNSDNAYSYSYNNLLNNYTVTNTSNEYLKLLPKPLEFVRAGDSYLGSLIDRGAGGNYWSSTPYTGAGANAYAKSLIFEVLDVYSGHIPRAIGFAVRCVLAPSAS